MAAKTPDLALVQGMYPMVDLAGYKLTFDDEFKIRRISPTGAKTTWDDTRADWRLSDGKANGGSGRFIVDASSGLCVKTSASLQASTEFSPWAVSTSISPSINTTRSARGF